VTQVFLVLYAVDRTAAFKSFSWIHGCVTNHGRGVWLLNGQSGCNCAPDSGERAELFVVVVCNDLQPLNRLRDALRRHRCVRGRLDAVWSVTGRRIWGSCLCVIRRGLQVTLPWLCAGGKARQEPPPCWVWYADSAGGGGVGGPFSLRGFLSTLMQHLSSSSPPRYTLEERNNVFENRTSYLFGASEEFSPRLPVKRFWGGWGGGGGLPEGMWGSRDRTCRMCTDCTEVQLESRLNWITFVPLLFYTSSVCWLWIEGLITYIHKTLMHCVYPSVTHLHSYYCEKRID